MSAPYSVRPVRFDCRCGCEWSGDDTKFTRGGARICPCPCRDDVGFTEDYLVWERSGGRRVYNGTARLVANVGAAS